MCDIVSLTVVAVISSGIKKMSATDLDKIKLLAIGVRFLQVENQLVQNACIYRITIIQSYIFFVLLLFSLVNEIADTPPYSYDVRAAVFAVEVLYNCLCHKFCHLALHESPHQSTFYRTTSLPSIGQPVYLL